MVCVANKKAAHKIAMGWWWLLLVLSLVQGLQTCETSLIQLKRGALELESRLVDCLNSKTESTPAPTPPASAVAPQEVLQCKQQVAELTAELARAQTVQSDLAAQHQGKVRELEAEWELERAKLGEVHAKALVDQTGLVRRELQEESKNLEAELRGEIQTLQDQLLALTEQQQLQQQQQQKQQQGNMNLDWASHLANLSLVLGVTEERMHQMSVESLVYLLDDETSNEMSGYLTWSILLLPAILIVCLFVRVKLSFERMVLWASLYCALLFLCLFGFSLALHAEAVQSLPKGGVHDVLVVLLLVGQLVLLVATLVLTLKQWLVEDRGGLRVRHLLQAATPVATSIHYYQFYFYGAILDIKSPEPLGEGEDSNEGFGFYTWLVYSLAYLLLCMCIALSHTGSKVQQQPVATATAAAAAAAGSTGSASNRSGSVEEDEEEEDLKDLEHASLPPSTQASSLPKTKKKKKSKGGLEEVLDKVADAVNTELAKPSSKRKGSGGDKKE